MDELLIKKLRFRENSRALVLNSPANYLERLGEENVKTTLDKTTSDRQTALRGERFDFVQVFIHHPQEISELGFSVLRYLKYDAIFWISFPKDLAKSIQKTIETIENAGFENVAQIALDENWAALRFRPEGVVF